MVRRLARYKNDDPSVTSIIDIIDKPALRYWYGRYGISHCEKIKKTSQAIGQKVHKAIEKYLECRVFSECIDGLDNDQQVMLSHLTNWVNKKKLKVISQEEALHSVKYKYNGTPDVVGTMNGGKTVIIVDWKTDSTPRTTAEERERVLKYKWQLSGYAIAYQETFSVKVNQGWVVRVSKKLEFKDYHFPTLTEGKKQFKQLREIYKVLKGK